MRDGQTEQKDKPKEKRFITVARKLAKTKNFTKTSILAQELNMDEKKFKASIQKAKEFLATHGYMVTNAGSGATKKRGQGYKNASFEEFEVEIHKSCARASAHIMQALKIVSLLERSDKCDRDLTQLKGILLGNLRNMAFPEVEKEFRDYAPLKPDFLNEMANEPTEEP